MHTPARKAKINKIVTMSSVNKDANHSYTAGGNMKWYSHSGKV
jgi:hypothetical protein